MDDDDERTEAAAALENAAIEAMSELVGDYGYDENDLVNLVRSALNA